MAAAFPLPTTYRWLGSVSAPDGLSRATVSDAAGSGVFIALSLPAPEANALASTGVKQRHLATVVECFEHAEGITLIAEHIAGVTLAERMEAGRVEPFRAAVWFLRLLEAIAALHEASAAHGSISPLAIVVEPSDRPLAPILRQLHTPPLGPYVSLERLQGQAPTADDDVWSLLACFYAAITGRAPFVGPDAASLRERIEGRQLASLAEAGLDEPELEKLFVAAFHPEPSKRLRKLSKVREALVAIERGDSLRASLFSPEPVSLRPPTSPPHAATLVFDEAAANNALFHPQPGSSSKLRKPQRSLSPEIVLGPQITLAPGDTLWPEAAPALAAPERATDAKPEFTPAFARKAGPSRWWFAALALVALGAAAAAMLPVTKEPAAPKLPPLPAAAPATTAPATTKKDKPEFGQAECLLSYFPPGTFAESPDLGFFCAKEDLASIARTLGALVRENAERKLALEAAAAAADPTAAAVAPPTPQRPHDGRRRDPRAEPELDPAIAALMPYLGELSWYDLPAAAIMKRNCCPKGAKAFELAKIPGYCPQLSDTVAQLAEASLRPADLSPQARKFDEAVSCVVSTDAPHTLSYQGAPSKAHRSAFQRFLTHAAVSDARRSALRR